MRNKKANFFGADYRIGRKLAILIVAFSSIIMLLISSVQLVIDYFALRSGLDKQLEVVSIYVPNMSESVWNYDEKQIKLGLDALKQLPNIELARIISPEGTWAAGKHASDSVIKREYKLQVAKIGKEVEVGALEVVASLDEIYRQVAASAIKIFLSNGIKTFLVSLFMLYLFRSVVTSRIETLRKR